MATHEPAAEAGGRLRLCDFIREHRTLILEEWERAARVLPEARRLSHPRLLDHLPPLLERMADRVESVHTGVPGSLEEWPEIHALQRLDVGFGLEQVTHEYSLLRTCILRLYGQHLGHEGGRDTQTLLREIACLDETFDEAVTTAVSRYSRARERTLVALDRISEAALGTEDLDTFLERLLRGVLETTESVDSVTLLLREGEVLRARASVGLEELVSGGFSVRVGEGFSGKIAAERRPLELRSAAADPLVRSEVLRRRGTRALYGVPLFAGDELIGVAHMGSITAFEFSNEDKLLFRAMVSRASALLVQTRLATREREAREAVRTHEELLRLVIEQSGDAIIVTDERGVLRVFNAEAERQHGVTRQQVAAPEWTATYGLLDLEERPMKLEATPLYRALHGEPVTDARWKVRRPDGSVRILSGTASPMLHPDGTPAGAVLSARDETERLRREAEQAETLALLDSLLSTAPIGLAFVDRELRYVRVNRMLADMNGKPLEEMLGHTVREVLPAGSSASLEPLLRQVFETGAPLREREVAIATAADEGRVHHYLLSIYPVRDGRGTVRWVGTVVVDITERQRTEEELRRAAEFRERFLGIVSHDLRNPLNAIVLSANALMRAEDLAPRHLKPVRRIITSAERMGRMIGELLDFTRGRLGGGIPVSPQHLNLRHLVRHVMEELEAAHPGRELRLEGEGNFQGEWDPDRLSQVIGNLGKNALDYSPEGTPVRLRLRDEGESVVLEVNNAGPPIPAELLPTIFEPFRRLARDSPHPASGLGLGLYIVEQIVRGHGGTLSVRSTQEEGTTFTVRLPRTRGGPSPAP
ncbi:PAS domain S-box-containing protein [Archangium gephyra]|uniref:histidine kinase n=1 Tax=Archangium gephyra TaxID=48 RepID=A0AAC8TCU7_9BACT|nr:PAS domain S-box protein [Archangium gephyra]AKJ01352.1 sensory box histidine kinase [Archangium gephyra]REG34171.1 PAS domain S-box-containing protein [Archangium gephyra]